MATKQPAKQEKMEPRRMQADPNNIWVPKLFHEFVNRICAQEYASMPHRRPPTEKEKSEMRQAAEFNINAYAVPAGNA